MDSFRAFRIHDNDGQVEAGFEQMSIDDLTDGEVVIKVKYSDINYKDALAATGKGKILRKFPLNGGIDLAGEVVSSSDQKYKEGDKVLVAGCGLSETQDGGYAEYARVPVGCVVNMPDGLSEYEAMALGTAGFTAALAVVRMEENNQQNVDGPIVVTGATGGVGSVAIDILSAKDYEVLAFTGKKEQHDYLRSLGASDFINRNEIDMGERPLEKAQWGGAVDNVGGDTLAWLTRTVKPWGNIASIGLAGGFKLNTTVMPFILRGVSLLGINSIEMSNELRDRVWGRLADDLKPRHLDKIVTSEISFDELPNAFEPYMKGAVTGRTIVKIS